VNLKQDSKTSHNAVDVFAALPKIFCLFFSYFAYPFLHMDPDIVPQITISIAKAGNGFRSYTSLPSAPPGRSCAFELGAS